MRKQKSIITFSPMWPSLSETSTWCPNSVNIVSSLAIINDIHRDFPIAHAQLSHNDYPAGGLHSWCDTCDLVL